MKIKDIVVKEGLAATYKIVRTGPEGTVLQSPDMHTTLTLDPEASKGIVQNPDNPNQFTLSQAQAAGTTNDQAQAPQGPKQGAEVEVPANEAMAGRLPQYDTELTIANPDFNAEDEDSLEEIDVGVNYSVHGKYIPARIKYDDYDHPAEYPEIEISNVVNLETGQDISDRVDMNDIESQIWDHLQQSGQDTDDYDDYYDNRYDEDIPNEIGGDPTDDFIDDVTDHEFEKAARPEMESIDSIKRLAGL